MLAEKASALIIFIYETQLIQYADISGLAPDSPCRNNAAEAVISDFDKESLRPADSDLEQTREPTAAARLS